MDVDFLQNRSDGCCNKVSKHARDNASSQGTPTAFPRRSRADVCAETAYATSEWKIKIAMDGLDHDAVGV